MRVVESLFAQLSAVTLLIACNTIVLAIVFTLLTIFIRKCNKAPPWWCKPDLSTDLCWAFLPALFYGFVEKMLIIFGIIVCYGIIDPDRIASFFIEGHGPLRGLDFWPQVMLYLVGSDLVMYWTHRILHGPVLWCFHAIHHSSKNLEWTSAARFHPIDHVFHGILSDVVLLLLGTPPDVLIWMMPFNVGTSALVHANLDWNFGPLRYLVASPVFHRWHHTSADRGGSSNFAGTFPLIDLMFGTFYMPINQRPDAYGCDGADLPGGFFEQLLQPFVSNRDGPLANQTDSEPENIPVMPEIHRRATPIDR